MQPSIVIITGNQLRHQYFANALAKQYDLKGIVAEAVYQPKVTGDSSDITIVSQHFTERDGAEKHYFGMAANFEINPQDMICVAKGESNSPAILDWINIRRPNYLVLYGSSLIREPLLTAYEHKVINMHLGLSPYYRGSGTNFWPLVNREPELVGATIHLATPQVDSGSILKQVRPRMSATDRCHGIGCKAIMAGTALMATCIRDYAAGCILPTPQAPGSRFYHRRDFSAEAVRKMRRNFETGMIEEYLGDLQKRQRAFPIVE